jgi:Domain of unknown function (DUF4178)
VKIQIRDVLSTSGRDYVVEGLVSYRVAGKTTILARAVDGESVLWIEPPPERGGDSAERVSTTAAWAASDRLLVLHQIKDLDLSVPPPESISYHGRPYVVRLTARATIAVDGSVPERDAGAAQLWRYRSAGDLTLQIEEENGRLFMLAGETVPRGMIDLLPGH